MTLHPKMTIRKYGNDTHMHLAQRQTCDGLTVQTAICVWLNGLRAHLSEKSGNERGIQFRLFYKDRIFPDMMLRLITKSPEDGGETVLVLARVEVAETKQRRGNFSMLRKYLEDLSADNGWSFVVECANRRLSAILSFEPYVRVHGSMGYDRLLTRQGNPSWKFDPDSQAAEISIMVSKAEYCAILADWDPDRQAVNEINDLITTLIARLGGEPAKKSTTG